MSQKVIELFSSDLHLYEIEKITGLCQKTIRKIWRKEFGDISKRGKGRNSKVIDNKLFDEFFSTKSMLLLSKEYNLDYRTIKKHWIEKYGETAVNNRYIINVNSIKNNKIIPKIFKLVKDGKSLAEIHMVLGIKKRTIKKYVSLDKNIYKKYLNNNISYRSKSMKNRPGSLSKEIKDNVIKYFYSNLFSHEIAKKFNISKNSVIGIFKNYSESEYKKRVKRLERNRLLRSMKGLEKAGVLGSKREINFYKQLKDRLNLNIIHHDYNIVPPYEIDITIPELKIAINWDGIGHFKPIFGEKNFNKVVNRDKYKRRFLKRKGWFVFVVNDKFSHIKEKDYKKIHDRFDYFLNKIGYGDYIVSSFKSI